MSESCPASPAADPLVAGVNSDPQGMCFTAGHALDVQSSRPDREPTAEELLALADKVQRELAMRDTIDFACYIDPSYAANYSRPHCRRIGEALDRVLAGTTTRLHITAPPRHLKSSIVCEKFALRFVAENPTKSVGLFSHGATLPLRFAKNVRSNVESNPRFRELYPHIVLKRGSENQADWSVEGAYRSTFRSLGVGSAPTGEGFDLIIIDDPIPDAQAAYSPTQLKAIILWYQETLRDRLNPGGAIVLVMSRWHENDLAGFVMKESAAGTGETWEQVHLPAVSNAAGQPCDFDDPTARALWPETWPLEALRKTRLAQGGRAFAARYQGSPRAMEGNLLDSSKLVMVEPVGLPAFVRLVRRWDLAFSEANGADYAAGVKMGLTADGRRYILDVERVHGRWTQTEPVIRRVAHRDEPECAVAIEGNGTQLGYYQQMADDPTMADRTVQLDQPEGSKEMRATLWGTRLEDGIIHCVRASWNGVLFDEMDSFPNGVHDDVVDGVSGAWKMLGVSDGAIRSTSGMATGTNVRSWGAPRSWPARR